MDVMDSLSTARALRLWVDEMGAEGFTPEQIAELLPVVAAAEVRRSGLGVVADGD